MRVDPRILIALCVGLAGCKALPKLNFLKKGGSTEPAAESAKDRQKREGAEAAFLAECTKLSAGGGAVKGRGDWMFSAAELKAIGATPEVGSGTFSSTVAAISDYRQQLKKQGVEVVIALLPPKALVFADQVSKEVKVPTKKGAPVRLDSYAQAVADALSQKGIKVVDLAPEFLKNRTAKGGGVYAPGGSGLTPLGARIAAEQIAGALSVKKAEGLLVAKDAELSGGDDLGGKPQKFAARTIFKADGATGMSFGESGGVVMICDASGTAWRKENASLAEQLCFELQRPIGLMPGSTARNEQRYKIMRLGTTDRNPLSGAKVLVWCFNSLELGSGDWRKVPLSLSFKEISPTLRTE